MLKNDTWIKQMAETTEMIKPFEPSLKRGGIISFGLSSFGYDFRLSHDFLSFTPPPSTTHIDPKAMKDEFHTSSRCQEWTLPPHSFVLARSLEYFRIPRNILGICTGKSTYSRCGVSISITPLEPEWEGHLTFPIFNNTPYPIRVYPGEGIAQVLFLEGLAPGVSYADRGGKYQCQAGITLARID